MISAILNFKKNFYTILLTLDSIIYNAIDWFYDIFVALTQINVFADNSSGFNSMVRNVYVILGVIMLFVLAYSLLRAVIDPEQFSKKDNSFAKLIQNIVISLVIISFLPTIFQFAFSFQDAILKKHTIEKIILNDENIWDYKGENNPSPGRKLSYSMFSSFFHVDYEYCTKKNSKDDVTQLTEEEIIACESAIKTDSAAPVLLKPLKPLNALYTFIQGLQDKTSFTYFDNLVKAGSSGFGSYVNFAENAADGQLTYIWFFSTVAGIYVAYVLINFVFDVALRYIKLIFFEIIAPIPVFCRVIPGGKFKDVFSTWLKKIISVFLEVFIRVFVMIFGLYLIIMIADMDLFKSFTSLGPIQKSVANALILLGVVTFIKQAPKLICDLFHIDSGDMKFGIAEKLAAGGGLMAASGAGALGLGAIRNYKRSRRDGKGVVQSLGNAVTGGLGAGSSAFMNARKAKSFGDMKNSASKGLSGQADRRTKMENYIAKRKNDKGGLAGAVFSDFTGWLTGKGVEDLDRIISASADVNKANDAFRAAAKKQWDKHSTDGAIVYDAGTDVANNFFKGAGSDRMFELYNSFRDSNNKMRSAAFIKSSIEQRKAEMGNRDINYYIKDLKNNLKAPDQNDYYKVVNGQRVLDQASYNAALQKYNYDSTHINEIAQANYDRDLQDLNYLDSMYNQLEKKSITEIGRIALEGKGLGTITSADLFEAKELGETAQRVIRDSGLEHYDPAKDEKVEVKGNDFAAFIDDMASAASKQAGHAAREKQNYLEKKKSS